MKHIEKAGWIPVNKKLPKPMIPFLGYFKHKKHRDISMSAHFVNGQLYTAIDTALIDTKHAFADLFMNRFDYEFIAWKSFYVIGGNNEEENKQ